jgi:hypothetical protein
VDIHSFSDSIYIARPAEALYDMVSEVTRMGEWSPVCRSCWWDEGDTATLGAWFTGHNESPERTWDTRSQVVVAMRGQGFAFLVGQAWIRWGYTFTTVREGTNLTESWDFLIAGIVRFHERYGLDAPALLAMGVTLEVVSETLGHASIRVTKDVYGRLLAESKIKAAEAMRKGAVDREDAQLRSHGYKLGYRSARSIGRRACEQG